MRVGHHLSAVRNADQVHNPIPRRVIGGDECLESRSEHAQEVLPLIVGETKRCVALTNSLLKRGIDVQPILYPGVRERAVRLRFFINGTHTEDQIRWTMGIVEEEWRRFGGRSV